MCGSTVFRYLSAQPKFFHRAVSLLTFFWACEAQSVASKFSRVQPQHRSLLVPDLIWRFENALFTKYL